jgi:hypothetical protein
MNTKSLKHGIFLSAEVHCIYTALVLLNIRIRLHKTWYKMAQNQGLLIGFQGKLELAARNTEDNVFYSRLLENRVVFANIMIHSSCEISPCQALINNRLIVKWPTFQPDYGIEKSHLRVAADIRRPTIAP